MIDLDNVFALARASESRDDVLELHQSDVTGCPFAIWHRLQGHEELPFDDDSLDSFLAGHAFEEHFLRHLQQYAFDRGLHVAHGLRVVHDGIICNLDYALLDTCGDIVSVIDLRTTKSKDLVPSDEHVLKTAGYAVAVNAPDFCEWVVGLGFGKVTGQKSYWYKTADFVAKLEAKQADLKSLAASKTPPPAEPPEGQEWRCGKPGSGKSYCQNARCSRNARLSEDEREALAINA